MDRAPFFTGRDYENGHFNADTSVELQTPALFGSFVDGYGTGFYLRPESGIKVFRNRNTPTTGLICGASKDDIDKSCARIIQDTLDDNTLEAFVSGRVLVLHSDYGSILKPSPFSYPLPGMPQIKPYIYVPPSSLENIRTIYSNTISADYARTNIHPLVIHEDNISLRHLLAILTPNGPPDSIWNLSFNRRLMQIVLSLPAKARYVDYAKAIVNFDSWDPSEKEFLFARFKLFETFLGDNAFGRNLHSQPFVIVDLSYHLIQDTKIDLVVLDVILNIFLSYRAPQRLVVCSGRHDYLSSDNVFKSTLWSMIESPIDQHTHLFLASQTPTLVPPDILSLLNCVVCHRFGSAAWATHFQLHFAHSTVPLEDYAPKLGSGEALLFAPEGASPAVSDGGVLRRWNGGCIRFKVASVKTCKPENTQIFENASHVLSRPSITTPLDGQVAAIGTPIQQPDAIPQLRPAAFRHAITPQPSLPFKSSHRSFPPLDDDQNDLPARGRGVSLRSTTSATAYQHLFLSPNHTNAVEQIPRIPSYAAPLPAAPSFAHGSVPFIIDDQNENMASTSLATDSTPAVFSQSNPMPPAQFTSKTHDFDPLIAAIRRARRNDEKLISRTDVGAHLSKADYEAIGLMGLQQVVQAAVTAGVIVTEGGEGSAWIGLPEWFDLCLDDNLATTNLTGPAASASNRSPVDIFTPLISVLSYTHEHLKYERPLIDRFAAALSKRYPDYLAKANCRSFFEYASLAEKEGIIVQGGALEKAWIALKHEGVVLASPTLSTTKNLPGSVLMSSVPLPTSQPPVPAIFSHATDLASDQPRHQFTPLIDAINKARKDEAPSVLWSKLGEMLKKAEYTTMGVSGLKACMTEAEKTGIIQTGKGPGLGQEWVALPEWTTKRRAGTHAAIMRSRSSTPTLAVPTLTFSPNSTIPIVTPGSSTPNGVPQPEAGPSYSTYTRFAPFIAAIEKCRQGDAPSVKCSLVGMNLTKEDYIAMGFTKWTQCLEAAEKDGLVIRGGFGGDAWVALKSWQFDPLVQILKSFKQSKGIADPYGPVVAKIIQKNNANAFQQAGVTSFEEYAAIAEELGLVIVVGKGSSAKIRLVE